MRHCFGVDIGGTTVKIGFFAQDGTLLDKWEIKSRTENGGENILPDITKSLNDYLAEKNLDKKRMMGIGVGIPGPVNKQGIVQQTANLGWGYKNIKAEFEELSGMKVRVENDANVAALGEMWKGGGDGYGNLVLITLGTGVGGGILVGGEAVVGEHGGGGEIGHMQVNPHEEEVCGCGRRGCLEQYASATGIARLTRRRLEKDDSPSTLREGEISAKTVFDAMKEGDVVATEVVEEFGSYLGKAIETIAVIIDPHIVVIGGGVSKAGDILLDYVKKNFRKEAFFANKELKFALAKLGNDAGIYGAAKLFIN